MKNKEIKTETTETATAGRRRFLKGAAAASPVIMTVVSRPVLGAQCTPSAWVSGNLSDHGQNRVSCGGRSPGYWKTHPKAWMSAGFSAGTCSSRASYKSICKDYNSDGTLFNAVFSAGNYNYDGRTLMQVMWLGGNQDPYQLGAHIVAALLNAATISNYGMKVPDVVAMYNGLIRNGGLYQPSVGDPMTAQDVVAFIQNTFE